MFRSPCASSQTTAEPAVARGEPLDRADVRAAAAAQDERTFGQRRRRARDSARERVLLDDRGLGVRERRATRRRVHLLSAGAPGARHADQPGPERRARRSGTRSSSPDGDRGEGAAVRALRPKPRHGARLPGDDRVERVRSPFRSVSSAARGASLFSPSRLIQTAGTPSSAAGRRSWNALAATCTWPSAVDVVALEERVPSAVRRLVGAACRAVIVSVDRHADLLDRGREEVRIRVREDRELPAARPQLLELAGNLGERWPGRKRLGERASRRPAELEPLASRPGARGDWVSTSR